MINPPEETAEADSEEAEKAKPELFASLHPPLVVNFKDALGDAHYMQITMEVMAREQAVIDAVKNHIPVIRNGLILLYGESVYEEVITTEGKEKMLEDGLGKVQELMSTRTDEGNIEYLKKRRDGFSAIRDTTLPEVKAYMTSQSIPCRDLNGAE